MGGLIDEGSRGLIPPPLTRPVHRKRRRRRVRTPRRHYGLRRHYGRNLIWTVAGIVAFLALSGAFALLYAGPAAFRAARDGRTALEAAGNAFVQRDADSARRHFAEARDTFKSAEGRLGSPITWPLRLVPIVNTHIRVGHSLAAIGRGAAEAGLGATAALGQFPGGELKMVDGRMDLAGVRRASAAFASGAVAAAEIRQEIRRMPTGWVVGALGRPRREALERLPAAIEGLQKGQTALQALPSLLAEKGTKRYVVAFSNLSELRGSGGFIGFVTLLRAEKGKLDLEGVSGRPTELFPPPGESNLTYPRWFSDEFRTEAKIFQNINLTTDFPTVGRLLVQSATPAVGKVDGAIGVDPVGIGAVLNATGPISVPAWPDPITAGNVSRVAQHDVYLRIAQEPERQEFFSQLVRTAFDKLTAIDVRLRPKTLGAFDAAVRAGHFRMYSSNVEDQSTIKELGLDGGVDRAGGANDVLSLISENATGNKIDWYLRRNVHYRVRLHPDEDAAETELTAELRNDAPGSGLPDYVIGSPLKGLPRGTNRQNLLLVRSPSDSLGSFLVGTRTFDPARAHEGALSSYRASADVKPRSATGVRVTSIVERAFSGRGRHRTYTLHVLPQPVVNADRYELVVDTPAGWDVEGRTRFDGALTDDVVLEVELTQSWRAWLLEKVFLNPWRLARDLLPF